MKYENSNNSPWEENAFHVYGERDREVIALMANRFIGKNPQAPYQYRLDFISGILCNEKGWYQFDFGSRFPQADVGEVCYGAGNLYSHSQTDSQFQLQCCGPTVLWVNGKDRQALSTALPLAVRRQIFPPLLTVLLREFPGSQNKSMKKPASPCQPSHKHG